MRPTHFASITGVYNVNCRLVRRWLLKQGYRMVGGRGHPTYVKPGVPPIRMPAGMTVPLPRAQAAQLAFDNGYPNARTMVADIQRGR